MNDLLRRLLYLPPQASSQARAIDTLHYVVIGCTMFGATIVFVIALFFLVRYGRRHDTDVTPRIVAPKWLEGGLITGTLSLFLALWVVGFVQYAQMHKAPRNSYEIYVTAKQWMWKFAYPDGHESVGVLTVPLGHPVRLIMTSRDVIHSFYVPAFRLKQDVIPGRYVDVWFDPIQVGVFDLFCAEYCGTSHSRMRAQVDVLSPSDFALWLERRDPATANGLPFRGPGVQSLAQIGREVAARRGCFSCHTIDGQRHIGPTWRGLYDSEVRLTDGRSVRADEAYLTRSMMDPAAEVVQGFGPVMPTYQGSLEAPDAAAIVEFIRSLRLDGPTPSVDLPNIAPAAIPEPARPVADSESARAALGGNAAAGPAPLPIAPPLAAPTQPSQPLPEQPHLAPAATVADGGTAATATADSGVAPTNHR